MLALLKFRYLYCNLILINYKKNVIYTSCLCAFTIAARINYSSFELGNVRRVSYGDM